MIENLKLENYPHYISIFKWKLPTPTLTITFGVILLCVNIFYILQNYDDPIEESPEIVNRFLHSFRPFENLDGHSTDKNFGDMHEIFIGNFNKTVNSSIPPDTVKRLHIGRLITLIRSSLNLLLLIPLIYGAYRFNSVCVLTGFIYWCTQSTIGWPLLYYFTGTFWDTKMMWEAIITIKLEIYFAVVTWGCYKYAESLKSSTLNNNPLRENVEEHTTTIIKTL